jgi:site-specific recombinase
MLVGLTTNVAASITEGRNAVLTLIVGLLIAATVRRCYLGVWKERLYLTIVCGVIGLYEVLFGSPLLSSASATKQVRGLVDLAIAVIYLITVVLLWLSASTAYFDADPHRRGAQQSPPGQADLTSRSQADKT